MVHFQKAGKTGMPDIECVEVMYGRDSSAHSLLQ